MRQDDPLLTHIADNTNMEADVTVGYSDEDIVLIDNVKLLAEPSPTRLQMNTVAFFLKGKAQGELNGQPVTLEQNQLLICPPNVLVSGYMLSPDFEMKAIFVSNRILQSFLREKMSVWTDLLYVHHLHVIKLESEEIEFLTKMHELLSLVINSKSDYSYKTEVMHSLMRSAFLALCGALKMALPSAQRSDMIPSRHSDRLFQQFLELLSSNPVKHHTVDYYATKLSITAKYLSNICKKYSGKTANAWITEHVMEDIRYYLISTDLSIKEICNRLGFPNPSFFGRYVKEHFGMTPTQFRTQ